MEAALAAAAWTARDISLKQNDDLGERIWQYFTKPRGENFSPALEELESGTTESCLGLFSLSHGCSSSFFSPFSSQLSLVEGCPAT